MYHPNSPHVVEGSDITALHDLTVEHHPSGRKFAHIVAELNPEKDFTLPPQATNDRGEPVGAKPEHMLHVTNGVNPRLLPQLHDHPKKAAPAKEADASSPEAEVSVKGHKVGK